MNKQTKAAIKDLNQIIDGLIKTKEDNTDLYKKLTKIHKNIIAGQKQQKTSLHNRF